MSRESKQERNLTFNILIFVVGSMSINVFILIQSAKYFYCGPESL